jgi:hypothetical protein
MTMPNRRPRILLATVVVLGAGICFLLSGNSGPGPARAQVQAQKSPGVLRAFAVGGILTTDGMLWQYLPDKKRWLTIDEAFQAQGKETKILPLPVKAEEIADLSTWGFLVSVSGACWLYDIAQNKWVELPAPGSPR